MNRWLRLLKLLFVIAIAPAVYAGWTPPGPWNGTVNVNFAFTFSCGPSPSGSAYAWIQAPGSSSWVQCGGGGGAPGGTVSGSGSYTPNSAGTWILKVVEGSTSSGTTLLGPTNLTVASAPQPPSAPVVQAATGITATGFTAQWSASSGATQYSLDVATDSSFSSYVSSHWQGLNTGNATSWPVTGLAANTTYYYRVRAVNAGGTSGNSSTMPVTTQAGVPGAPTASAATSITSAGFSANWSSVSGATGYRLDVSTSSSFGSSGLGYQDLNVGSVTSWSVTGVAANTTYYYRVRAVSAGGTSSDSNTISVTTLAAGGAGPFTWGTIPASVDPGIPTATDGVGVLSASQSVDNKGASNIRIPLYTPPGRSGMQPTLELVYNSGGGNGPLGVGFSVSNGFPQAITRGRTILARDETVRGVNFDSSDRYYLDGKRLIRVGGVEGQPGSTYRTEVDSFVSITASGTGTNIETFVVVDKSGRAFTFGKYNGTNDGYQMGAMSGETLAYAYALKHVRDAVDNTIDFNYVEVVANSGSVRLGEYVLGEILYTANPTQSVAAKGDITFHYNISTVGGNTERNDRSVSYVGTRLFAHSRRLDAINVKFDGSRVGYYSLGYEYSPNYGPLRLKSVQAYMADGAGSTIKLPLTSFSWDDKTFSYSNVTAALISSTGVGEHFGFGDVNGDGKDDLIDGSSGTAIMVSLRNGTGFDAPVAWTSSGLWTGSGGAFKICDVNGDGRKDVVYGNPYPVSGSAKLYALVSTGSSFVPQGGGSTPTTIYTFTSEFLDPGASTANFLNREKEAVVNRITTGDFNGDGKDDILIHRYDGKLQVLQQSPTGSVFTAQPLVDIGANALQGSPSWELFSLVFLGFNVTQNFSISMMPCDLNGDGRTDYAWVESTQAWDSWQGSFGSGSNAHGGKTLYAVTSLPAGGFSQKALVSQYGWGVSSTSIIPHRQTSISIMPADVNGDGLTDFVTLLPGEVVDGDDGYYQHKQALLTRITAISLGSNGTPQFNPITSPDTSVTIGGQQVRPWFDKITMGEWVGGFYESIGHIDDWQRPIFLSAGLTSSSDNVTMMDVNSDGKADYVWYVDAQSIAGWYALLSVGDGTYSPPVQVPLGWTPTPHLQPQDFSLTLCTHSPVDLNGDGLQDFTFFQAPSDARPGVSGLTISSGRPGDRLTAVVDGLGKTTSIAYRPITDDSVYTRGADVSYPIRELRNANYVVSDVWQDSGGATTAHFIYQYSGNRLDLSGRGALGFHSFVTLDTQTNVFKYQFLAQSFPMTGLTQREETYRYISANNFNIISSHDNTVVFDKVSTGGGATLWPFISKAVEYRWEDGAGNITTGGSTLTSDPENVFNKPRPITTAHITITAQSSFDGQTSPQFTLPGVSGYNPSDTNGSGQNTVVGTSTFSTFSGLPGNITYGNLTQLYTDFGDGSTETVATTYKPISYNGLPGLVDYTNTTETAPGYSDSAPTKTYTYFGSTPLVSTEVISGVGSLGTTTTYNRDALGRVTSTTISGTDLQLAGQGAVSYTMATHSDFDERFDLPKTTQNAYSHTTTTAYGTFLGLPTSITQVNGDQYTTSYDALGRTLQTLDVNKELSVDNSYTLDTSQSVGGPSGFNGVASGAPITGVVGMTLTSAYKVTTTQTAHPTVATYYDHLGRVIRTIKNGFNNQEILTDTAYNNLGQMIATSLPYISGTTVYWTKNAYDALGRVATVTAPNGTITTNTYKGRATSVNVTPVVGTAQTNTTVVDARGRTVKVWNADNVPAFSDTLGTTSTAPSIGFFLDGFGRMRKTLLSNIDDTTHRITASYDALGRQLTLNDPDKGSWSYVNSALGQVLTQTDARTNLTSTIYDKLGRSLTRTTSEPSGPAETASWFYYDSTADAATHRVSLGDKGWIGALQREESSTTSAPGYAAANSATTTVHYYDAKGRPSIDLTTIDGKWFYTYTDYDTYSRVSNVRHYWRPAGSEAPSTTPYVWQDFGYTYNYDAKSYLTSLTDSLNRTWWSVASDGYDYLDRPVKVQKGSGHWTQRTYRAEDGVLTAIATGPTVGATSIQDLSFSYDGLGNLTSRSGSGGSEALAYDNLNRLTSDKQGAISYFENGNIKKKPDVAGTMAPADFTYDGTHPHAVATAFGYSMGYDASGNLSSRTKGTESWSFRYAGFDKPRWMAKTVGTVTVGSEFLYNANRSRTIQLEFDQMSGGVPSHYVRKRVYGLGSTLEANYENSAASGSPVWALKKVRIYVPGPDGVIGAREFDPGAANDSNEKALVYHYDHLGSIESITPFGSTATTLANDDSGKSGRFSEDAWGTRRNTSSWSGAPSGTDDGGADSLTPRGFTGHEMLDDLGLVHMNGRIYDPLLGRMLSADIMVQAPGNLQAYNRYSYVFNNPLSYTDPSGFKTIDDYEKEKEKARSNIRDLIGQVKAGKISLTDFVTKAYGQGRIVVNSNDAIRHIGEVAQGLSKIADMKVDARQLDDVDPTFKAAAALTTGMKVLPGLTAGNEASKGNYGAATKEYAKDVALTLIGMRIGKWLTAVGPAEGKVASEVVEEAVEQTAKASANGPAANRAAFEAYKDTLRAEMSRPPASNAELNALLDKLYRPNAQIGSGSTAAAVRQELATGQPVGGALHSQKAQEMITALQRWLGNNPGASSMDRAAAENVIKDMQNALGK